MLIKKPQVLTRTRTTQSVDSKKPYKGNKAISVCSRGPVYKKLNKKVNSCSDHSNLNLLILLRSLKLSSY